MNENDRCPSCGACKTCGAPQQPTNPPWFIPLKPMPTWPYWQETTTGTGVSPLTVGDGVAPLTIGDPPHPQPIPNIHIGGTGGTLSNTRYGGAS
jgi:hypothetical protein